MTFLLLFDSKYHCVLGVVHIPAFTRFVEIVGAFQLRIVDRSYAAFIQGKASCFGVVDDRDDTGFLQLDIVAGSDRAFRLQLDIDLRSGTESVSVAGRLPERRDIFILFGDR